MNDAKTLSAEKLAEVNIDFYNAIEDAAVNAKMQIAALVDVKGVPIGDGATVPKTPPTSPPPIYKLERISWETADGPHGPYERTRVEDAATNTDLKLLLEDLRRRQKFVVDGFFVWAMKEYKIACRKRLTKQ